MSVLTVALLLPHDMTFAAPLPKAKELFVFPMRAGMKWEYKLSIDKESKNLSYILEFDKGMGSPEEPVFSLCRNNTQRTSGGKFKLTGDGLYALTNFPDDLSFESPICVIQFPHKAGGKWENKTKYFGMDYIEARTAYGPETVKVPSGSYQAIKIVCDYGYKGQSISRKTEWFVSEIGLVKMSIRDEIWELMSFSEN
jgi:hypothetical protein